MTGVSQSGVPLSSNRAPAADLRPWVGWMISAKIRTTPGSAISCGMLNDLVYVRVIFDGAWEAHTADGWQSFETGPLLFGQQSRFMPLTCRGHVMSAGFGLRAGALHALLGRDAGELLDRIEVANPFGLSPEELDEIRSPESTPQGWSDIMEGALRRFIARTDPPLPDPLSTAFELAAFTDPQISPAAFAENMGVSLRTLQRIVRRDFGMSPKHVLRRARLLDFAAQVAGVADDTEAEEMALRFFDQSHLTREFGAFFGVTPREFRAEPRPFMTITLEQRQARRLDELARIAPGAVPPWRR